MELSSESAQIIVAIGAGSAAIIAAVIGNRKSDGKSPAERPPSPHEVKEALSDLRRLIDALRDKLDDHDDDHRQIARQLDRIENRLQISAEIQHFSERTVPPR